MPTGCYEHKPRKHGYAGKYNRAAEYRAYAHAKGRCQNSNDKGYKFYGGRGVQFLFMSFEEFIQNIGLKPSPAHSLDRIDNNGHYEVGNVRWATRSEQMKNRRGNGLKGLKRGSYNV